MSSLVTNLRKQLRQEESTKLYPYTCDAGFLTIGTGRNLDTNPLNEKEQLTILGECMPNHEVISSLRRFGIKAEQADYLLDNDIEKVIPEVDKLFGLSGHSETRQAAIIGMAFQLGIHGLSKFKKTRKFWQQKNYNECAIEMLDSEWARVDTPERAVRRSIQVARNQWQLN